MPVPLLEIEKMETRPTETAMNTDVKVRPNGIVSSRSFLELNDEEEEESMHLRFKLEPK